MKICVAQTRSVKGDINANITRHKLLIKLAVSQDTDIIVFPELSLTGYEPTLAQQLAIHPDDSRLEDFQEISNDHHIIIGVGVPTISPTGICISMVLFYPNKPRQIYSKKYIHPDEAPYFVPGQNATNFINNKTKIALAICYEISVPEHAEDASKQGATVYIASVAKVAKGFNKTLKRLSEIAKNYNMTVLMSNCIGQCDGGECAGKTSIWNNKGILTAQLYDTQDGIIILNTETHKNLKILYNIP